MRKDAFSGTVTSKIQKVDVGDGKRDLASCNSSAVMTENDCSCNVRSILNSLGYIVPKALRYGKV
jgi:hypothetical protein